MVSCIIKFISQTVAYSKISAVHENYFRGGGGAFFGVWLTNFIMKLSFLGTGRPRAFSGEGLDPSEPYSAEQGSVALGFRSE